MWHQMATRNNRKTGGNKMSDERIIIDKDDYHKIKNLLDQISNVDIESNFEIELESCVFDINELLDKAQDPGDEPVTANDKLRDQLNILIDSTTAAADDAVKALNILKGDE